MNKLKTFVAESGSPEDLYHGHREGHVVEEIVRLLDGKTSYKIVMNMPLLCRAIKLASANSYDIFHLSCHGDKEGIQLGGKTDISWKKLAECFQEAAGHMPKALVISSCAGGDVGIARAFKHCRRRPDVIFGAEGMGEDVLTFPGACTTWPILYTKLATCGMTRDAFKDAVDKMNHITSHRFVYRRWKQDRYLRHPPQTASTK
jgi:hypothetical protein